MMAELLQIFKTRWLNPPKPVTESFEGKVIIVTGATNGIGLEAVAKFAALGAAKVIMTARDMKKGESVKAAIETRLGRNDQLEVWELDMTSVDSVVAFARRAETLDHLDIAVLNAGVHKKNYSQTSHGWEEDIQVNTLSSALLGILLLPKLKASKQVTGKIPVLEFVNSGLHRSAIIKPETQQYPSVLQWYNMPEHFVSGSQYKYSKVFLMHAANKLASEISSGDVIITSICPGVVRTDLGRDHYFPGVFLLLFIARLLMLPPEVGANAILSGTVQGEMVHGRFWKSDKIQPVGPSLAGDENKKLGLRVWREIVDVLKKEAPVVDNVLELLSLT